MAAAGGDEDEEDGLGPCFVQVKVACVARVISVSGTSDCVLRDVYHQ